LTFANLQNSLKFTDIEFTFACKCVSCSTRLPPKHLFTVLSRCSQPCFFFFEHDANCIWTINSYYYSYISCINIFLSYIHEVFFLDWSSSIVDWFSNMCYLSNLFVMILFLKLDDTFTFLKSTKVVSYLLLLRENGGGAKHKVIYI